jgi:hypothetical protein
MSSSESSRCPRGLHGFRQNRYRLTRHGQSLLGPEHRHLHPGLAAGEVGTLRASFAKHPSAHPTANRTSALRCEEKLASDGIAKGLSIWPNAVILGRGGGIGFPLHKIRNCGVRLFRKAIARVIGVVPAELRRLDQVLSTAHRSICIGASSLYSPERLSEEFVDAPSHTRGLLFRNPRARLSVGATATAPLTRDNTVCAANWAAISTSL